LALNQTIVSQGLIAFWNRPISRGILFVGGFLLLAQVAKAIQVNRRAVARQRAQAAGGPGAPPAAEPPAGRRGDNLPPSDDDAGTPADGREPVGGDRP